MQLAHSQLHGTHCVHCGHDLPGYGAQAGKSRQLVVGISIGLHVLALLLFLAWNKSERAQKDAAAEPAIVYLAPQIDKPHAKVDAPVAKAEPARNERSTPRIASTPVVVTVLPPNEAAITLPMDTVVPSPAVPSPVVVQPSAESAQARSELMANLNAESRRRSGGAETESSGGAFSIVNMGQRTADIKFRGWDPNFKRNWAHLEHVDIQNEIDLETAIIKKLIRLIRMEKPGDFVWYSRQLKRDVPLSGRVADERALFDFLMLEMFPDYR